MKCGLAIALELGPPNDCRFINETAQPCVYLVVRLNHVVS